MLFVVNVYIETRKSLCRNALAESRKHDSGCLSNSDTAAPHDIHRQTSDAYWLHRSFDHKIICRVHEFLTCFKRTIAGQCRPIFEDLRYFDALGELLESLGLPDRDFREGCE